MKKKTAFIILMIILLELFALLCSLFNIDNFLMFNIFLYYLVLLIVLSYILVKSITYLHKKLWIDDETVAFENYFKLFKNKK